MAAAVQAFHTLDGETADDAGPGRLPRASPGGWPPVASGGSIPWAARSAVLDGQGDSGRSRPVNKHLSERVIGT